MTGPVSGSLDLLVSELGYATCPCIVMSHFPTVLSNAVILMGRFVKGLLVCGLRGSRVIFSSVLRTFRSVCRTSIDYF